MRDLFFAMYGTGIEWTVYCLFFLLMGIILLTISLVKLKKEGKSWKRITTLIISILFIWQIIPMIFYWNAYFAGYNYISNSKLIAGYNEHKRFPFNFQSYEKYMKIAANTSLIPWQKGSIYCKIANGYEINKQGQKAIEWYNKAYKYIKSYKYKNVWLLASLLYNASGNTDIAVRIADEQKLYKVESDYLIGCGKYDEALSILDKESIKNVNYYTRRAYLNRVLGNKDAERADYQSALSLVRNDKERKSVYEYKLYGDKVIALKKRIATSMGFAEE